MSGGPEDFAAVPIELSRDENDAQNVDYDGLLLEALKIVEGHPVFEQISKEDPPSVINGGLLAPFNQQTFTAGLSGEQKHYMCGINLAWVNWTWSATPGIPIR